MREVMVVSRLSKITFLRLPLAAISRSRGIGIGTGIDNVRPRILSAKFSTDCHSLPIREMDMTNSSSSSSNTTAAAAQDAEITLHWLDKSRSQRVVWLFEEIGLKYRLVFYKRRPDKLAPSELKVVHPLGKSPVVEIKPSSSSKDKALVLAETANIVEYVVGHFGRRLIPGQWKHGEEGKVGGETREWLRYRFFMHYNEGSLMSLIAYAILKDAIKNAPLPFFLKPITGLIAGKIENEYLNAQFDTHLAFLEKELSTSSIIESTSTSPISDNGPFFCGPNLTAADIMMCFGLEAAQEVAGLTREKYPLLTDYVTKIHQRPAYQSAIQRITDETGTYESGL